MYNKEKILGMIPKNIERALIVKSLQTRFTTWVAIDPIFKGDNIEAVKFDTGIINAQEGYFVITAETYDGFTIEYRSIITFRDKVYESHRNLYSIFTDNYLISISVYDKNKAKIYEKNLEFRTEVFNESSIIFYQKIIKYDPSLNIDMQVFAILDTTNNKWLWYGENNKIEEDLLDPNCSLSFLTKPKKLNPIWEVSIV